ncbi:MAG: spermidine synthase-like protein, partial [Frankiales bacterium]|nr:spermidine synthase-like protein [Frankiales bacterium]
QRRLEQGSAPLLGGHPPARLHDRDPTVGGVAPRRPAPVAGRYPVDRGTAELLQDADRDSGWELDVEGVPQSYVDTADLTHLEFEYVRLVGDVLDLLPEGPLDTLHLGGGACTLPRYVAATRPGSRQLVVEADAGLVELVRSQFGTAGFKLRTGDARAELERLEEASSDAVVGDVFVGAALPPHTATLEHVRQVRRVLRPGGTYVVNVADGPPLAFARAQVATLTTVFPHVVLLADPGVLRGRRFGNVVLAASALPLPLDGLRRRAARAAGTARVVAGADLVAFVAGSKPVTDATATAAPLPPPEVFRR